MLVRSFLGEKSVLAAREKIAAKKRERRLEEVRLRREEKEISVDAAVSSTRGQGQIRFQIRAREP